MEVDVGAVVAGTDVEVETAAAVGGGATVAAGPVVGEGAASCACALDTDAEVGASCGSGRWGVPLSLLEQATDTAIRQTAANIAIRALDMCARLPIDRLGMPLDAVKTPCGSDVRLS
jgi:hypothetical protein